MTCTAGLRAKIAIYLRSERCSAEMAEVITCKCELPYTFFSVGHAVLGKSEKQHTRDLSLKGLVCFRYVLMTKEEV